ncbi:hypothetical protein KA047_00375 [Candidatus Saccharibacteria bacterium]|nr:hypothetical protein [Candidatus Saccharibacteria bacterium]
MLDQGAYSQQTGGGTQTTNPQSVPSSDLQPQENSLQGPSSQVLGAATFLEQSSTAAISVDGQQVNNEITELKTNQTLPGDSLTSAVAGREFFVVGAVLIVIGVLAYVLSRQIMRDHQDAA